MKACPHCRLPLRNPGAVYPAVHEGIHYAFLICAQCYGRLSRLPVGTRIKALNRCADNVVDDPGRYAHRAFSSELEARLFAGLAGDLVTSAGVVAELLQGDLPSS
jgi:hypothetical protein